MPSYSLSGSGGRTSGVNYAIASMFDRMRGLGSLQYNHPIRRASLLFSTSYQAVTGASVASLKRIPNYNKQ
jgi:hypothetical protein